MRRVISSASMRSFECTLADDHVELREQVRLLVERAVVEDVDLDAGEDAERRQLLVELGDDLELLAQPLGRRPLATVSRGEWSVSTMYSWPRSRAASAITSIGLPPSDQSECVWQSPLSAARMAAPGRRPAARPRSFELGADRRHLAGERLEHDLLGLLADAGEVLQAAGGGQRAAQLVGPPGRDGVGGAAEGAHPVGRLAGALEQVGDALQGFDRAGSLSRVPRPCVLATGPDGRDRHLDLHGRRGGRRRRHHGRRGDRDGVAGGLSVHSGWIMAGSERYRHHGDQQDQ